MKRNLAYLAAPVAAIAAVPASAAATGPDFSTLTGAIDFGTTQTALLSVGALVVGLALVIVGIRWVLRMVKM